jgi:hypothetical protein
MLQYEIKRNLIRELLIDKSDFDRVGVGLMHENDRFTIEIKQEGGNRIKFDESKRDRMIRFIMNVADCEIRLIEG